jgi:hypothetical protein
VSLQQLGLLVVLAKYAALLTATQPLLVYLLLLLLLLLQLQLVQGVGWVYAPRKQPAGYHAALQDEAMLAQPPQLPGQL